MIRSALVDCDVESGLEFKHNPEPLSLHRAQRLLLGSKPQSLHPRHLIRPYNCNKTLKGINPSLGAFVVPFRLCVQTHPDQ